MLSSQIITIQNLEQTAQVAHTLARALRPQDVVLLKGDLGAGKTTFARYLIQSFFPEIRYVPSPTFNLVLTYAAEEELNSLGSAGMRIWHFDLYRLRQYSEVYELGILEAFAQGISIIEWPQIIMSSLPEFPENYLEIELLFPENINQEEARQIVISCYGPRWLNFGSALVRCDS